MNRRCPRKNSLFGPGNACDACSHPNWDLHATGSLCYKCRRGIFMHRSYWRYLFDGEEFICATPKDDVTEDALRVEYLRLAEYHGRYEPLSEPLAERVRWAQAAAAHTTAGAPGAASNIHRGRDVAGVAGRVEL